MVSVIGKYSELYSDAEDRHVSYAHLSWEDLRQMQESGVFEVQNHTYDMHKNKRGERRGAKKQSGESSEHYKKAFCEDVSHTQRLLAEKSGITPLCFTYPFGMISDDSLELVRELGFRASLSCEEGVSVVTRDPDSLFLLKRCNRPHNKSAEKILN